MGHSKVVLIERWSLDRVTCLNRPRPTVPDKNNLRGPREIPATTRDLSSVIINDTGEILMRMHV